MIELETPHEEFRMFVTIPKNWLLTQSKGVVGLLLPLASLFSWNPAIAGNLVDKASANTPTTEVRTAAEASQLNWPTARGDAQSTGHADQTLPEKLQVIWEYKADEAIETTPVVVGKRVFVSDVMGKVYAIDRATGKEIWKVDFDTGFLASPAVKAEELLIGDIDGNLYKLNAVTGEELWRKSTDGEIQGSVAFHGENVLVASGDGKLHCFRLKDGKKVWTYEANDQIRCSPTVAGDRTFLGGCDGQLHVVDLKTGEALGKRFELGGPTGSTPSVVGNKAFLPIMDGVVLAFDWKAQKELWQHMDEERPQEYRNSAAVTDELVVLSSQYKQVDAISTSTGKLKWRHTLRRRADASPVIAGKDVWIAATDGRLIRLELENGTEEKWSYEIRGSFLAGPAIAGQELFIADDDGVVRCFGAEKGQNKADAAVSSKINSVVPSQGL
jgi:outer membrane protein assembly factor BamB